MSQGAWRNFLLLMLCLTAGIVDVIGFLELGHVFTANMTGNIVLLGMAIGQSQELAVLRALVALIGFMAGNVAGAVIIGTGSKKEFWARKVTMILTLECMILLAFSIVFRLIGAEGLTVYALIALLSCAMGLQTTAARKLSIASITTTVLTSTLTHMVEDTVAVLRHLRKRRLDQALPYAVMTGESILRVTALAVYLIGAIAGALTFNLQLSFMIWIPAILLGGVVIMAYMRFHRQQLEQ